MKQQDNQEVLENQLDANAVEALSEELTNAVAQESGVEGLFDEKKEELEKGVLAKAAQESVEVASSDTSAIDVEALAQEGQSEAGSVSGGGAGGGMSTNTIGVLGGLGAAALVGVALSGSDGSSGGGSGEEDPDASLTDGLSRNATVSAPSVSEGDNGTTVLTFTVTLDKAPRSDIDLNAAVTGGTANGDDVAISSGKVSFATGQTSATFTVIVNGDVLAESDETVEVTLTGGGLREPVVATGTILDDDTVVESTPEIFTLTETYTTPELVDVEPITKTITFIGFNPHAHGETGVDNTDGNNASDAYPNEDANAQGNDNNLTNENPFDGGIPLYDLDANYNPVLPGDDYGQVVQKGLMSYITDLTGLDFVQLGLINIANGAESGQGNVVDNFPDISDITLNNNGDGTQSITVVLSDGTENTSEVQISDQYFTLLTNLLFDSENNLRLYEQEVTFYPQVPVTVDVDGESFTFYQNLYQYESGDVVEQPIILTTTQNNGGTEESGLTSASDNLIVAGRLDLLHGAYIDAGEGNNTLEIDAKGYYAQPKALLNIQQINIENLPNVYTSYNEDSDELGSSYPDLDEDWNGDILGNSVIDLSRAVDLQALTITESNFEGLAWLHSSQAGSLTVAGIRNGAPVTLDGSFTQDVTLHFSEAQADGVYLVFNNLSMGDQENWATQLNVAHNAETLHIESTGGGNFLDNGDLGGNLSRMIITGDAHLHIEDDLDDTFNDSTAATIDASANTGGVDLTLEDFGDKVTFLGSSANDVFTVEAEDDVVITGQDGDNQFFVESDFDVTLTAGDGNNQIEARSTGGGFNAVDNETVVIVTVGSGNNDISVSSEDAFAITAGNGDNRIEAFGGGDDGFWTATDDDASSLVLGDGQNEVIAISPILSITAGNGGNEMDLRANDLTVASGTGDDVISAVSDSESGGSANIALSGGNNSVEVSYFNEVYVATADGDDSVTIVGGNINFGIDGDEVEVGSENGNETLINIDLGQGTNTITFGSDADDLQGVTAVDGSTIDGSNLTLVVNRDTDLSRAQLNGVTAVQMRGDEELGDDDASTLTLTVTQFLDMGGSTAFSTIGQSFGAHSVINLVVDQSVSLDDLDVDALPRSIDFSFEVMDGVALTMTAQQLHERVANMGVTAFVDGNGDFAEGSVYITGGSPTFNENDAMEGGSIHPIGQNSLNVYVSETVNGYDRPADVVYFTRININTDTDLDGGVLNPFTTDNSFLRITGNSGLTFVPVEAGLDEWGQPIPNAGDSIELASDGDLFLIDYSTVGGDVEGLVIDHFEKALDMVNGEWVGGIYGNGIDARLDVKLDGDVGAADQGLISSGVQTFVVVDMYGGDHTFWTCETTQDLETLGLRGEYDSTITFGNTERGVDFLMEVEYVKSAGYVVGALVADFARAGGTAVVNVVNIDAPMPEGEVQHIAGIDVTDAISATINVTGGDTVLDMFATTGGGTALAEMIVTADADLDLTDAGFLPSQLASFDGSGVVGVLSASVDLPGGEGANGPLTFVGAAGGTELNIDDAAVDAIASIDGAGVINLTIGNDLTPDVVDLTGTFLGNIGTVTQNEGTTLSVTFEQADAIGAEDFLYEGAQDAATLNLVGLNDQVFAIANYPEGLMITLTLAAIPEVHINPLTDFTGIDGLVIPEGTTLFLTMEQFQQLEGDGTLTGDGSVVITDVTQASVGEAGADLDMDDVDLNFADGSTVTLVLAESVDLSDADIYSSYNNDPRVDTFILGDDMTLTLGDIQDADGVAVIGGTNSTLKFTDVNTNPFETIDASGFAVTYLYYTNTITNNGNRNIDDIFSGLSGDIEKVSYFGEGYVVAIDQVATIEETVTVTDSLVFNPSSPDVELNSLTLNMMGGTEIDGNLRVSTDDKWDDTDGDGVFDGDENELVRAYLRELVINSNGTDQVNLLSGVAANVITGDITPNSFIGGQNNNLLSLTINATQAFILEGDVVLNSNVGAGEGDQFTSNDIEDATATITVSGTADVTLGGIDSSDSDVDAVVVNNTGSGSVFITLNDNDIDATDSLSFTGTPDSIHLTIEGDFDLSDDDLSAVETITLTDLADVVLSFAQLQAIGVANVLGTATPGDNAADGNESEDLVIVDYDGSAFDFSAIDAEIEDVDLVMASGDITLDPAVNLTGITSITVPEGGSLSLTAAQFQQLTDNGTIVGVAPDGTPSSDFTVNITSLMQSDIDYDLDGDGYADSDDGFSVEDVTADSINISLGEAEVNLADFNDGVIVPGSVAVIDGVNTTADFILTDLQTLGIATYDQANGLNISGTGTTTAVYMFADLSGAGFASQIDASGYDITILKALAASFAAYPDANVEYVIDDLASSVELRLYQNPEELGFLDPTFRVVTIEEDVVTPTDLAFNDWDTTDEVLTLLINFEGNAGINGDLRIPTRDDKDAGLVQQFFQQLTLNSTGSGPNFIAGDIEAQDAFPGTVENNLLSIDIIADEDFVIGTFDPVTNGYISGGDIFFTSLTDSATAYLNVSGDSNVTLHGVDVTDSNDGTPVGDIGTLVVTNNSTGTLTMTGGTAAIAADNAENLVFEGTGDIVLGNNDEIIGESASEGVDSDTLSSIDASGLSGDFTVGEITDVDPAAFSFTAGTGVTNMTFMVDDLDSTGLNATPGDADDTAGWTIDFTGVAPGSELHLSGDLAANATAGSVFNVLADGNTTIYIDSDYDLSALNASLPVGTTIVLADEVSLTLTAAQANNLTIVAGTDLDNDGNFGQVNIVGLTNDTDPDDPSDAFDLSNISADVAGTINLAGAPDHDDVTLDKATDLGFFSITLDDLGGDNSSLAGQTIRFQNIDQAERAIIVNDGGGAGSSTNVVWLFTDNLGGTPVNTDDYSAILGRLFILADFIDNNGGDVEDTFTSLPNTILRVPADDLNEVNVLLQSNAINRIVEIEHFEVVGNLIFNDSGIDPEEHIESVTLRLGGQTTIGNVVIDDVFGANVDPNSVSFNGVTIESYRAVTTGDALANENFVNDNDGVNEEVSPGVNENVQPNNINTVGNIGVGGGAAQIDLTMVTLDTGDVTVIGDSSAGLGANLTVGDIIYDTEVAGDTAMLVLEGANKITAGTIDWSDVDFTAFMLDVGGFTGVFDPILDAGTLGETFTIEDVGGSAGVGTVIFDDVTGDELSTIDASGSDENINLTISNIDGNDDALNDAFTYTASSGINTIVIDGPTLEAGSTWNIDLSNAAYGSSVTLGSTTVLEPGSTLNVDLSFAADPNPPSFGAQLVIDGAVDLTGVTLNITGGVIEVLAGSELTLSIDELAALFAASTPIIGEGTLIVTGDATDADPNIFQVAALENVDLSALTIDTDGLNGDDDATGALEIKLNTSGAVPNLNIPLATIEFTADDVDDNDEFVTVTYEIDGAPGAGSPLAVDLTGVDVTDADAIAAAVAAALNVPGDLLAFAEGPVVRVATFGGSSINISDVSVSAGTTVDLAADVVNTADILDVVGINVTGSAEDDVIEGSARGDTFTMGAGDDTIDGGEGDDTFNVTSGTDTINDLTGEADDLDPLTDEENDVLVVSAGATAMASTAGFVATADTSNAGAATITGTSATSEVVIDITADDVDDADETLTVTYTLDGIVQPPVVVALGAIDSTDPLAVAAAVAAALDLETDVSATASGAQVTVTSDNGDVLTIGSIVAGGTVGTLDTAFSNSVTVDMSAATGPNGYTIVGNSDGRSTLSGSAFNDVINDGDAVVLGTNTVDILTGNGGSDTFTFTVNVSNTAQFAEATVTPAIDREVISITADGADENDEHLLIDYTLNGVAQTQLDVDLTGVDVTDAAAVAAAVITALDARAGISAVVGTNPEDIVVSGDAGGDLTIDAVTPAGTTTTLAGAIADGVDQAQETTLTVTGTPTAGDVYSILAPGEVPAADYTALPGDDADAVAAGLAAAFNAAAPATTIDAAVVGNVITFTDEEDDNGGFSLVLDSTAAFGGSSATGNIANFDELDVITDFTTGQDFVDFGLLAGVGSYTEVGAAADYATALTNADAAFDGSFMYYLTSATDLDGVATTGLVEGQEGAGILFADANLDGTADLAILLLNVDDSTFAAGDIVGV